MSIRVKLPDSILNPFEYYQTSGSFHFPKLVLTSDTYVFDDELSYNIDFSNTGESIVIRGCVKGSSTTECARCLEEIIYEFNAEVEGLLLLEEDSELASDLAKDEFDILPKNLSIDIEPYLVSALVYNALDVPLCSVDCLGLCKLCGCNLNERDCCCDKSENNMEKSNPFEVLKSIKFSS